MTLANPRGQLPWVPRYDTDAGSTRNSLSITSRDLIVDGVHLSRALSKCSKRRKHIPQTVLAKLDPLKLEEVQG